MFLMTKICQNLKRRASITNKIFSAVELSAAGYYPTEQVNTHTHILNPK